MNFLKKWFGKEKKDEPQEPALNWIAPTQNPWGIQLLDLRPITKNMLATSTDPQCATNAVSYQAEDGLTFIGMQPEDSTEISCNITIPIDTMLAPGVLFNPQTMEHKWAIYYYQNTLIFVRSWQRQVYITAQTAQVDNALVITSIKGSINNESAAFTRRLVKYLLISYCIEQVVPAPLPPELADSPNDAALWAFSTYGDMAEVGVFDESFDPPVEQPLRSHSLLHIAVARGDFEEIENQVKNGLPLHLLANDGLTPLHWAIAVEETLVLEKLLTLGANPDAPSAEGATPLMNAVQYNRVAHLNLLLHEGANPNATDNRGFTSLHRAAEMGHLEVLQILLKNGANKDVAAHGHTALSLATEREHPDIISALQ
ncbi:ankyrin repeat domain-containing protein [Chitinophaga deserti]|uniref:ankyrin repeat domain-containing protein n=1 Tax=Chitinophaga deserti TaxID=2164099 RepID=UPI000D6B7EF7|nr:ankyrin repeat domain-containing protein [Chitinophaga deserti]